MHATMEVVLSSVVWTQECDKHVCVYTMCSLAHLVRSTLGWMNSRSENGEKEQRMACWLCVPSAITEETLGNYELTI